MEFLGLTTEQWTQTGISALIIVVTASLGRWVITLILVRGAKVLVARTQTTLDDAIVEAVRPPTYLLAVIIALQIAINRLDFLFERWEESLDSLFFILYLALGFVFAARIVGNLFNWYGHEMAVRTETNLDEQLLPFFRRVASIILAAIAIIILLGHFDVDVSGLVATLGIGSLAIALAAQAALSDTISGFIIMIDRPFRIGDRIELLDLDTWGDVVDIGLRSSRIRTRDNRMVIVPNSVISKSLVVNYSYPNSQYRIQVHIGIAYGSDIELARQTIIDAVRSVDGVLPDRAVEALFLEFGASALIFRVRWWLDSYVDTRRMFDRVNTAVYHALREAGIHIPMPQRVVHHRIDQDDVDRIANVLRGN